MKIIIDVLPDDCYKVEVVRPDATFQVDLVECSAETVVRVIKSYLPQQKQEKKRNLNDITRRESDLAKQWQAQTDALKKARKGIEIDWKEYSNFRNNY